MVKHAFGNYKFQKITDTVQFFFFEKNIFIHVIEKWSSETVDRHGWTLLWIQEVDTIEKTMDH